MWRTCYAESLWDVFVFKWWFLFRLSSENMFLVKDLVIDFWTWQLIPPILQYSVGMGWAPALICGAASSPHSWLLHRTLRFWVAARHSSWRLPVVLTNSTQQRWFYLSLFQYSFAFNALYMIFFYILHLIKKKSLIASHFLIYLRFKCKFQLQQLDH